MYRSLARWCHQRPWTVVGAWLAAIVAALAIAGSLRRSCKPDELARLHTELVATSGAANTPQERDYFDTPMWLLVAHRFPWLFGLMLLQSVSGFVVEHFEALIQQHIVLAAFLTMLVGGGGNSSGQTVAELVKRMGTGGMGGVLGTMVGGKSNRVAPMPPSLSESKEDATAASTRSPEPVQ